MREVYDIINLWTSFASDGPITYLPHIKNIVNHLIKNKMITELNIIYPCLFDIYEFNDCFSRCYDCTVCVQRIAFVKSLEKHIDNIKSCMQLNNN